MSQQSRRRLLKVAIAGSVAGMAGCLGDDTGSNEVNPTPTPTDTGDGLTGGDQLFFNWTPAPIDAETAEFHGFIFIDLEQINDIADLTPEDPFEGNEDLTTLPIGEGTVNQLLRITPIVQDPEYSPFQPIYIFDAEFDRDELTSSIENYEDAEWDDQFEYEGFTIFTIEGQEEGTGWDFAVSDSIFLFVNQTIPDEGTQITETLIDSAAGRAERIQAVSDDINRLYEQLEGSTFVEFSYGRQDDDPTEGFVNAYTLTETTAERSFILLFESADSIDEQQIEEIETGLEDEAGFNEVTTTTDGGLVTVSGSVPIEEFTGIEPTG